MLGSVALVASLVAPPGAAQPAGQTGQTGQTGDVVYASRPDIRQAPPTLTTTTTGRQDPGLLLTTPMVDLTGDTGAALYDNDGQLVWYGQDVYTNLQEITYRGESALAAVTVDETSEAAGRAVVLDSSYAEIASFTMDGYSADLHTLAFNEDASRVLLTAYVGTPHDLSEYGGAADAIVMDTVVQEIDTATGEVTFEWTGLDHISPDESHASLTQPQVDYLHTNSVAYANDGDVLLSARHTSTIYRIDTRTGEIVWRFGGENSDFTFAGPNDMPSYQHDASMLPDGRLAAFDNGVGRDPQVSRGAVWEIDERAMTAELVRDLQPGEPVYGEVMGSNQPTSNGNRIVNYGNSGQIAEFDGTRLAFSAAFEPGSYSYKVTRTTDFVGTPAAPPDVAWTEPAGDGGSHDLSMSWNGATEVDGWRLAAGRPAEGYEVVATVEKTGFVTRAEDVTVPEDAEALRISALDDDGHVLGSRTIAR